uniref:Rho-GAP domain-containing protein n=1 Tax=Hucho hucho TaxID=62062 RepID=A0A4W5KLW7_9TELE
VSLPPCLTPSLSPCLTPSLSPCLTPSPSPSLPPCLPVSLTPSLSHSLPLILPPSLLPLPLILPPSLLPLPLPLILPTPLPPSRTLYIEGERKLDFQGWCVGIQRAAGSAGDSLSQQQLTETDIPVVVDRCIDYITQCGLTSEGIYRKSGVNSRVAALCEAFRRDARSVRLKEEEHQVDDVSNTLKRFFRESGEGLFTIQAASAWLSTPGETYTPNPCTLTP